MDSGVSCSSTQACRPICSKRARSSVRGPKLKRLSARKSGWLSRPQAESGGFPANCWKTFGAQAESAALVATNPPNFRKSRRERDMAAKFERKKDEERR